MADAADTTEYRFDVQTPLWEEWKDTVPRSKNLDERIVELLREDLNES